MEDSFGLVSGIEFANELKQSLLSPVKGINTSEAKTDTAPQPSYFYLQMNSKIEGLLEFFQKNQNLRQYMKDIHHLQSILKVHKKNYEEEIVTRRLINGEDLLIDPANNQFIEIEHKEATPNAIKNKTKLFRKDLLNQMTRETLRNRLTSKTSNSLEYFLLCALSFAVVIIIIAIGVTIYCLTKSYYSKKFKRIVKLNNSYVLLADLYYSVYYAKENYILLSNSPPYMKNLGFEYDEEYENYVNDQMVKYEEKIQLAIESNILRSADYRSDNKIALNYYDTNWKSTIETVAFTDALLKYTSYLYNLRLTHEDLIKHYFMLFIQVNLYSSIAPKLIETNEHFYEKFKENNLKIVIILTITVSVIAFIFVFISCFFAYRLNSYSLEVIELFLYLPFEPLSDLMTNCEIFSNLILSGNAIETERKHAVINNESTDTMYHSHRRKRKYRNFTSFLQYSITLTTFLAILTTGYFVTNSVLEYIYIRSINNLLVTLDSSIRIESELQLSFNYMMECMHTSTGMTSGTDLSLQGIFGCKKIREGGLQENYDVLDRLATIEVYTVDSTSIILEEVFQGNLCQNSFGITPTLPFGTCEEFVEGSATEGLKVVLLYYLQLLRQIGIGNKDPNDIVLNPGLMNLYLLIREFAGPFMKKAIEVVIISESDKYDKFDLLKLSLLIVLIIIVIIIYLLIWRVFAQSMANNVNVDLIIG